MRYFFPFVVLLATPFIITVDAFGQEYEYVLGKNNSRLGMLYVDENLHGELAIQIETGDYLFVSCEEKKIYSDTSQMRIDWIDCLRNDSIWENKYRKFKTSPGFKVATSGSPSSCSNCNEVPFSLLISDDGFEVVETAAVLSYLDSIKQEIVPHVPSIPNTYAGGGSTLRNVMSRGELNCVVTTGAAGFATPNDDGRWEGFDVDFCRGLAAAVLGDPNKVKFVPTTGKSRFTVLNSGEGDVLFGNSTISMSRDADLKLTFLGTNYYDGQGFMVHKSLGVTSARQLDGASVCIQTGTIAELNLTNYYRKNNMKYEPVTIETDEEGQTNFLAGRCDVYTADTLGLAATRGTFDNPNAYVILPEIISKEPLGPEVRSGDDQWADVVRGVMNTLIAAEELGMTQNNIRSHARSPGGNPSINLVTGTEGDFGAMIGLDKQWAVRAILAVGNYGEIFERNLGANTPLGLPRGLNAQWTDGGLLYAPPIR